MGRGHAKTLTLEQIERIREMRTQQVPVMVVAREMGVSRSTVWKRAGGLYERRALTVEDRARIRALRKARHSVKAVARELGISETTVSRHAPHVVHLGCLTRQQTAWIRDLRARGYTAAQVAKAVGVHRHTVLRYAPGRIGKVPVAPLREAFLRSPLTAADVARELGWWSGHKVDSSRVRRTLGLADDVNGRGKHTRRAMVDAETVERIADVLGISPWSVLPDDESEAAA